MAEQGLVNIGGRMVPAWILNTPADELDKLASITPYLDKLEWILANYSNDNLLDNAYFIGGGSQQGGGQFPINQRGLTSYGSNGYTIDRWRSENLSSFGTITIGANGVTISHPGAGYTDFIQVLDLTLTGALTFSVLLDDGVLCTATGEAPYFSKSFSNCTLFFDAGNKVRIRVYEGNTITMAAAKLELGPYQTLAYESAGGGF